MANLFRESRMSLVLGPFFLAECFMNEAQLYKFPVQQRPKCGALNHPDMNPWESSFQIDHRTLVETYLKPPSSSGLIHLNHNIEQNIPQKKGGLSNTWALCKISSHSTKTCHLGNLSWPSQPLLSYKKQHNLNGSVWSDPKNHPTLQPWPSATLKKHWPRCIKTYAYGRAHLQSSEMVLR